VFQWCARDTRPGVVRIWIGQAAKISHEINSERSRWTLIATFFDSFRAIIITGGRPSGRNGAQMNVAQTAGLLGPIGDAKPGTPRLQHAPCPSPLALRSSLVASHLLCSLLPLPALSLHRARQFSFLFGRELILLQVQKRIVRIALHHCTSRRASSSSSTHMTPCAPAPPVADLPVCCPSVHQRVQSKNRILDSARVSSSHRSYSVFLSSLPPAASRFPCLPRHHFQSVCRMSYLRSSVRRDILFTRPLSPSLDSCCVRN
jgi:hypothetical protein